MISKTKPVKPVKNIYKITLMDDNTPAYISDINSVYTYDIEDFEKNAIETGLLDEDNYQRYLNSKLGKPETDFYPPYNPELEIVQVDRASMEIFNKRFKYENKKVVLRNAYNYESEYVFKTLTIDLKAVTFKGKESEDTGIVLIGIFNARGCASISSWPMPACGKQSNRRTYKRICVYGNQTIRVTRDPELEKQGKIYSTNKKDFEKETMKMFCYKTLRTFEDAEEAQKVLRVLQMQDAADLEEVYIQRLMEDIPGEAG